MKQLSWKELNALDMSELQRYAKTVASTTNSRIRRLGTLKYRSRAYDKLLYRAERSGSDYLTGHGYLKANKHMSRGDLLNMIQTATTFLGHQTSTVTGAKKELQKHLDWYKDHYPSIDTDEKAMQVMNLIKSGAGAELIAQDSDAFNDTVAYLFETNPDADAAELLLQRVRESENTFDWYLKNGGKFNDRKTESEFYKRKHNS